MEEVLRALNQLVAAQVIAQYAIGGAVGASFYIEALQTEDVDAFVSMPPAASGLVSLAEVYRALVEQRGEVQGEHVRLGNWPLQILTDANELLSEAIHEAVSVNFGGVPTRVFRAEHLVAVALQTGRRKDFLRASMFVEQCAVSMDDLRAVLKRHNLLASLEVILPSHREDRGDTQ